MNPLSWESIIRTEQCPPVERLFRNLSNRETDHQTFQTVKTETRESKVLSLKWRDGNWNISKGLVSQRIITQQRIKVRGAFCPAPTVDLLQIELDPIWSSFMMPGQGWTGDDDGLWYELDHPQQSCLMLVGVGWICFLSDVLITVSCVLSPVRLFILARSVLSLPTPNPLPGAD